MTDEPIPSENPATGGGCSSLPEPLGVETPVPPVLHPQADWYNGRLSTILTPPARLLLSGDEAVALAARDAGVHLGTGYPGTPSTEILEHFSELGGKAQWSPNEKVALEVAIGAAYSGARALVTMKHVGLNVAADPLFTLAYTGVTGALVLVSADDPGMASSQNEQDNRHYAVAAGVPMLEPSDSQEAYDYTLLAIEISERSGVPVLLRITTRVCHSKTVVRPRAEVPPPPAPQFVRDVKRRVMIPAYARPAHQRLRAKLHEIAQWNDASGPNRLIEGGGTLGILTSGVAYMHAREAAPEAAVLKLGMTYPLPLESIRAFAGTVERLLVIEEGDPYLADAVRAAGIPAEAKPEMYRFGELNVERVRRILAGDLSPEPAPPPGTPPSLCKGCPHRIVFQALGELDCIVSGDIGCYSLGVLPPFSAIDALVCMGAAIGVGLGMRHTLSLDEARRVVSVIGDSTFVHSGITGLVEMAYNPPPSGHLLIILDNGTTAMTGLQEHPGTGRTLDHQPTGKVNFEELARSLNFGRVHVLDPTLNPSGFRDLVKECLDSGELALIVARRDCLLAAGKIKMYEKCEDHHRE
jgi:indolepyruvate ferredoxin oxidoreductase, alpha subunit